MRPKFGIWLDTGRAEYGFARPRLTVAKRCGIAVVAVAVVGVAVRSVYSPMGANSQLDSLAATVASPATGTDRVTASAPAVKPRTPPQTIGLAPIGTTDRSAMAEPQAAAEPAPAPAEHAQAAAEAAPVDLTPAKVDESKLEKPRAKKKVARSAPAVQVYEMPDGRQVVVRRPTRNDSRYADGAGSDPWGFRVPRAGQRFVARPGLFEAPF
jgi:hypothetical protein